MQDFSSITFLHFSLWFYSCLCVFLHKSLKLPRDDVTGPVVRVINRGCQCLHPDVFPCSHQCKSGLHQIAQKNARAHTKTHTDKNNHNQSIKMHLLTGCVSSKAVHLLQSDTALLLCSAQKAQTQTKIHYIFIYIPKTLLWLYNNVSL